MNKRPLTLRSRADGLFAADYLECGLTPVSAEIDEVLGQVYPELTERQAGGCIAASLDDEERLEALFAMFGVPLRVRACSPGLLIHAYDTFSLAFGTAVRHCLRNPTGFRAYMNDWPEHWHRYVEAVAGGRKLEAALLARELGVLRTECRYPPGVRPADYSPPPADTGAFLDAFWAIEDARGYQAK